MTTPPENVDGFNQLGALLLKQGKLAEATSHFRAALAINPRHAVSQHNLGVALSLQQQPDEAIHAYRAALAEDPDAIDTWMQLIAVETSKHGPAASIALLYEALSYVPEQPMLLQQLAQALVRMGRWQEAITHYWHALRVTPDGPARINLQVDLAQALQQGLRLAPAESLLRQALASAPAHPRVHVNLGAVLYHTRRFREAEQHFNRVIQLVPDDPPAWANLAMVQMALGDAEQALAHFRKALAQRPHYPMAHSNLLLAMQYSDQLSHAEILAQTRRYGETLPRIAAPPFRVHLPGRPLRVGYVSGDFRRHVVGLFLLPVFAHHDPVQVEIYAYSMVDVPDPMTQSLKRYSKRWTDIRAMNDAALARHIRSDKIDILVDLSGHTADNRLPVFAHRPAPIQVSWLGYPGCIGVPAITHRITDAVLDPVTDPLVGTETPLRLPDGWFCYVPPPEWGGAWPVGPLPASKNGYITFGAFNNLAKVSASCLDLWARILTAVPGSRLCTRAKPFDDTSEQQRFKQAFDRRGVDPRRIQTLPYLPDPMQHLKVYDDIDIHLDSLPYSGGTTSCDALWMGAPVVTLSGDRPAARLGASVLTQLHLDDWIAHTPEQYVQIACAWASDPAKLGALRARLRERFRCSALHDAAQFTRNLEAAYRRLSTT